MPKTFLIKLSTRHKALFAGLLAIPTIIIAISFVRFFSYLPLENVARTLPAYYGIALSSGEHNSRECYASDNQPSCKALTIIVKDKHDTTVETTRFVNATESQGVKWYNRNTAARSVNSEIFEKDGRKYTIYILHGTTGDTWISLVEL